MVESWEIALQAERKAPGTISSYLTGVRLYLRWLEAHGLPDVIDKRAVQSWTADLLAAGAEASTVRVRQLAVRRFSAWLAAEGEIPDDPMLGVRPPKIDVKVVDPLTEAELQAMLATCDRSFIGIRDAAIIRFLADSMVRSGELLAMKTDDLDIRNGTAVVKRGKGGKGRVVPYGSKTAQALDRYLRARRSHKHADSPLLWLGQQGATFGYRALHKQLGLRAKQAGVQDFRPHRTRHTAATRWLQAGGSEGGLLSIAGWQQRSMLDRYTKATASQRAADEAHRLGLGDRL